MLPAGIGSKMERERRGADIQWGTPHLRAVVLGNLVLNCILTRPCDALFVRICADIMGTSVMPRVLTHAWVKVCRYDVDVSCRIGMSGCLEVGMCGRTCEQRFWDILIDMLGSLPLICVLRAFVFAALMCIKLQRHP